MLFHSIQIDERYLPIRIAPDISQTVAKIQAERMVSTPEPTLVPNELATSFAPIPNDSTNAITKPIIMIHNESGEYGSNMLINRRTTIDAQLKDFFIELDCYIDQVANIRRALFEQENSNQIFFFK